MSFGVDLSHHTGFERAFQQGRLKRLLLSIAPANSSLCFRV